MSTDGLFQKPAHVFFRGETGGDFGAVIGIRGVE